MTPVQVSSRAIYVRLLGYVRPYWVAFAVALVCMALTAAAEPVFPAIMKALDEIGYRDWVITEQGGGDTLEGLQDLAQRVDQILAS